MSRSDRLDASTPTSLTHVVQMELVDELGGVDEVEAELHYDQADPYAVRATFTTPDGPVVWDLGRDLLADGSHEPSGDGDVHVWPCLSNQGRAVVVVELGSPEGWVMLQVGARELHTFLAGTHAVVAPGAESTHVDVDAAIAAILAPADQG